MGLPCARDPAGHRRKAARKGLGPGDRAQLSLPAGGERLGEKRQGRQPTYTPAITRRAYHVWSMRERLDTLFGGDLAAAVHALVSESGCGQSELEQAMKVLEEKHLEAEEYDLYDPYG